MRYWKRSVAAVACVVIVVVMVGSSISSMQFTKISGPSARILSQEDPNASLGGNGTAVLPVGNAPASQVVQNESVKGNLPRGLAPSAQNSSGTEDALDEAPGAHWYNGAQYSGTPYLATSVSFNLVVPYGYDVASEFYYVLLSVWDNGENTNSYTANSYDQLGLNCDNGRWWICWSYTTPEDSEDGMRYWTTNDAYLLSTGTTECMFHMGLSQGYITYDVWSCVGGAWSDVWSTSTLIGNDDTHFIIADEAYYPYFNHGQGDCMTDFTDYLECWYMEPSIKSPAFNWEFLYTSADDSYVSTYSTFIVPDPDIPPKWIDTYTGADGYVMIWSGLGKMTDFSDSTAYSIGSSVKWEDNSVWLAWRGSSNSYLNIMSTPNMRNWGTKTTLTSQSSPYGPSIIWTHLFYNSQLILAWVGTGSSNYINTMRSSDGVSWTNHWIGNSGSTFPKSDRSPSLAFDSNNNVLYMAYKAVTSKNIVILKSTDDAYSWSKIATLTQKTRNAPAIAWSGLSGGGQVLLYLAFGSDANPGYINVMQSTDGVTWTNQKALPDRVADSSALAIGLTCTRDGLSVSWYDYATSMVSFRRSAGGDPRFWGEKFSLPFGTFYGSATMCGLPKLDRYVTYSSGLSQNLNIMKVCWNTFNPRWGTVDGFVDGLEDSTAFSQDWQFVYGVAHNPTTTQHHRGSHSYMMTQDLEDIQHNLLPSFRNAPVGLTGLFEVWMYDPGPSTYVKVGMAATETSPSALQCSMGIRSDVYSGYYSYRYQGTTYYNTGVARTQGWHCFQIAVDGTNTIGYIDGAQVFTVTWLVNVNNISIGDMWSDGYVASSVAWDDVSFSTTYVTAT